VKRWLWFVGVVIAVCALGAWIGGFMLAGAERALWTSAAVAVAVQGGAFAIARRMQPSNVMAGWGLGMLIRVLALGAYALVATRALGLAPGPALVSLAAFFFLTTLIEPIFLKS